MRRRIRRSCTARSPTRELPLAASGHRGLSTTKACKLLLVARSMLTYKSRLDEKDAPVIDRMAELAGQNPRYGYRRIRALLSREGLPMSPRTSVWQSVDPLLALSPDIGLDSARLLNAYSYSHNNPMIYRDPDGRIPLLVPLGFMLVGVMIGVQNDVTGANIGTPFVMGAAAAYPPVAVALGGMSVALTEHQVSELYELRAQVLASGMADDPDIQSSLGDIDAAITYGHVTAGLEGALTLLGARGLVSGAAPNAGATVRANAAQGAAFEAQVAAEMEAQGWTVAREVTLQTRSGARTRMYIVGTKQGQVRCVECKSSSTARLTPGQRAAHPDIGTQGAVVKGRGKPSVPGGTTIPPTSVEIVRPQ